MKTAREVMSTALVTVDPSAMMIEAARVMSEAGAGSALVLDGGSLVGIILEVERFTLEADAPACGRASRIACVVVHSLPLRKRYTAGPTGPRTARQSRGRVPKGVGDSRSLPAWFVHSGKDDLGIRRNV
jgi:hypothetical protein